MKLGIMQGRLSEPVNGHIQEFPFQTWKNEFDMATKLGLSHIEWLITENSYRDNPIFYKDLSSYSINTICCDHLIHQEIEDLTFLRENLIEVADRALDNKIPSITIPILEKSSMVDVYRRKLFIDSMLDFKSEYPSLYFIFEPELDVDGIREIVESDDKFFITYDTGNITSFNNQHEEFVKSLLFKIKNVHIKDRKDGKTVEPFTGDTDFDLIFKLLKNNYFGNYTLQVARSVPGEEYKYIESIKTKFETYYESI